MAYRFSGTNSWMQFAINVLSGYTFGPVTAAAFLRPAVVATQHLLVVENLSSQESFQYALNSPGNKPSLGYGATGNTSLSAITPTNTSLWYLVVATASGSGSPARFHVHDGTSWTHADATLNLDLSALVAGTDKLYVSAPADFGSSYLSVDMVCCGIKKANSTDLQVEALNGLSFSSWTGFGFDWLLRFDNVAARTNVANPGTGDEITRNNVTLVADPPGWVWAPVGPVYYRSAGAQADSTNGGTISVAPPAGHQAGDLLVLSMSAYGSGGSVSTPSGWTPLASGASGSWGPASNYSEYVYWKLATSSSEPSVSTGASGYSQGQIFVVTGSIDQTTPIDVSVGWGTPSGNGTLVPSPAITTVTDQALIVYLGQDSSNVAWNTPPSGATERFESPGMNLTHTVWADFNKTPVGSKGTDNYARASGGDARIFAFAVRPAAAAVSTFVPQIMLLPPR
jgi:hypothetical protein